MAKKHKDINTCFICGDEINPFELYYTNGPGLVTVPVCSIGCYRASLKALLTVDFLDKIESAMGISGDVSPMPTNLGTR